jgi:hypothetical protein
LFKGVNVLEPPPIRCRAGSEPGDSFLDDIEALKAALVAARDGRIAALLILESLCGQPEQMKRFVGFIAYFQAPFGTVSKACDDVADELRAHLRTLVPCGVMIC